MKKSKFSESQIEHLEGSGSWCFAGRTCSPARIQQNIFLKIESLNFYRKNPKITRKFEFLDTIFRTYFIQKSVSERQACRAVNLNRGTYRYQASKTDDHEIMQELSESQPRCNTMDIEKIWTKPIPNWPLILNQLAIRLDGRLAA